MPDNAFDLGATEQEIHAPRRARQTPSQPVEPAQVPTREEQISAAEARGVERARYENKQAARAALRPIKELTAPKQPDPFAEPPELKMARRYRSGISQVETFKQTELKDFDAKHASLFFADDTGKVDNSDIEKLQQAAQDKVGVIRGALTPSVAGDETDSAKKAKAQLDDIVTQARAIKPDIRGIEDIPQWREGLAQERARKAEAAAAAAERKKQAETIYGQRLSAFYGAEPEAPAVPPAVAKKVTLAQAAQAQGAPVPPEVANDPEVSFWSEFGKNAADLGRSFSAGGGGLVKMLGDVYGLATGDMDNATSKFGAYVQEYWNEGKSADLKAREAGRQQAIAAAPSEFGKFIEWTKATVSDPLLVANAIGEQVPQLVPGMGAGAVVGKVGAKLLLRKAGQDAVKIAAATKLAAKVGTAAGVAAGAVMQGSDVGAGSYADTLARLEQMPDEEASAIPEIAAALANGEDIDVAKTAYALMQGRKVGVAAGVISLLANGAIPGGNLLERVAAGKAAGAAAGAAGTLGREVLKAGASLTGEVISENVEELGGLAASNIAARQGVDPSRPITQGMGETAAQSTLVSGIMGGPAAASEINVAKKAPPAAPAAPAANVPTDLPPPAAEAAPVPDGEFTPELDEEMTNLVNVEGKTPEQIAQDDFNARFKPPAITPSAAVELEPASPEGRNFPVEEQPAPSVAEPPLQVPPVEDAAAQPVTPPEQKPAEPGATPAPASITPAPSASPQSNVEAPKAPAGEVVQAPVSELADLPADELEKRAQRSNYLERYAGKTKSPADLSKVLDELEKQEIPNGGRVAYAVQKNPAAPEEVKTRAKAIEQAINDRLAPESAAIRKASEAKTANNLPSSPKPDSGTPSAAVPSAQTVPAPVAPVADAAPSQPPASESDKSQAQTTPTPEPAQGAGNLPDLVGAATGSLSDEEAESFAKLADSLSGKSEAEVRKAIVSQPWSAKLSTSEITGAQMAINADGKKAAQIARNSIKARAEKRTPEYKKKARKAGLADRINRLRESLTKIPTTKRVVKFGMESEVPRTSSEISADRTRIEKEIADAEKQIAELETPTPSPRPADVSKPEAEQGAGNVFTERFTSEKEAKAWMTANGIQRGSLTKTDTELYSLSYERPQGREVKPAAGWYLDTADKPRYTTSDDPDMGFGLRGPYSRAYIKEAIGLSAAEIRKAERAPASPSPEPESEKQPEKPRTDGYQSAKAEGDQIEAELEVASSALRAIPGIDSGAMGLTPEAVKITPAYIEAKRNFDRAFARLRTFNQSFTKQFKTELAAERAAKRSKSTPAPLISKGANTPAEFAKQVKAKLAVKSEDSAGVNAALLRITGLLNKWAPDQFRNMEVFALTEAEWTQGMKDAKFSPESGAAYNPETNQLYLRVSKLQTKEAIVSAILHESGHFAEKFVLSSKVIEAAWAKLDDAQIEQAAADYNDSDGRSADAIRKDPRARSEWVAQQFARIVAGKAQDVPVTIRAKLQAFWDDVKALATQLLGSPFAESPAFTAEVLRVMDFDSDAKPVTPDVTPVTPDVTAPVKRIAPAVTPLSVKLPDNPDDAVQAGFAIVESADIKTSFDDGYDMGLQPRDRSRAASREQIEEIARKLDPEQVSDSVTSDTGSPIADNAGNVLSGNGRTEGIRLRYSQPDRAAAYRAYLAENAASFGSTPEAVRGMKRPILVRVVTDFGGISPAEFARRSNPESKVLRMSPAENAAADGAMLRRMPEVLDLFRPDEDGNVFAASNREFLNRFLDAIGNKGEYVKGDGSGYIINTLKPRVENAILASVIGPENRKVLDRLVESQEGIKTVVNGLTQAAPSLVRLEGTDYALGADLGSALQAYLQIKESGETLEQFLAQDQMFGEQRTPSANQILTALATARSAKAVTSFLSGYAELASKIDTTSGDMFGQANASPIELLQRAGRAQQADPAAEQATLGLGGTPASAAKPKPQAPAPDGSRSQGRSGSDSVAPSTPAPAKKQGKFKVSDDLRKGIDDLLGTPAMPEATFTRKFGAKITAANNVIGMIVRDNPEVKSRAALGEFINEVEPRLRPFSEALFSILSGAVDTVTDGPSDWNAIYSAIDAPVAEPANEKVADANEKVAPATPGQLSARVREAAGLMRSTFSNSPVTDPSDMMGPDGKETRRAVMSALLGRKATIAESGIEAITREFARQMGLPDTARSHEVSDALRAAGIGKPLEKPAGLRTQDETLFAGKTPAELLAIAERYTETGPIYSRNVKASYDRLKQSVDRGDKFIQMNADELAVRLENIGAPLTAAAKPTVEPPAAPEQVFTESYTGPRWTYGMRNRPAVLGTVPKGFIIGADGPAQGRARHGTVQYPRELTKDEIYDFELEVMEAPKPAPELEAPAANPERAAIIDRIVEAASVPNEQGYRVVERKNIIGSDGKTYGANGLPIGVRMVGTGDSYYVFEFVREGTTHGSRYPTREAAQAAMDEQNASARADLRTEFEAMDDASLNAQRQFWLKEGRSVADLERDISNLEYRMGQDKKRKMTRPENVARLAELKSQLDTAKKAEASPAEPSADGTDADPVPEVEPFTPENAAAELAKRGITVTQDKTNNGKTVWRITGKTFDVKDALKELGANWYGPAKAWSIFSNENPTKQIADALAGTATTTGEPKAPEDTAGDGDRADEDARLRELRGRLDGGSDERRDRNGAVASVDASTAELIRQGLKFGMPADVVDDQIEDISMIASAYAGGKPAFILGNGAGTGKTFVLGGAIREMRAKGAKSFVYVTMNQDLIEQIKSDLADFGVSDVKFFTYSEMSTKTIPVQPGSVLIFDEAHNIKNEESARAEKAQPMMASAKFTIFASATPFENPVQAAYLGGTGLFNSAGGHVEWGKAYGATVLRRKFYNPQTGQQQVEETLRWQSGKLEDGLAARQWFVKQGVMVTRPMRLPMEMVESNFTKRPAAQKWVTIYDRVNAAYDEAMSGYRNEDGTIIDATRNAQVSMHMTNTVKRILEASKVQHAIDEAQKLLSETDAKGNGKNVVIFVETKADRWLGRYKPSELYQKQNGKDATHYAYPQMAEMMDEWKIQAEIAKKMGSRPGPAPFAKFIMDIASAMHSAGIEIELPSVEQEVVDALGGPSKVGVYTGSVTGARAKADKEAFLRGEKRVIVATMAKGGTGLSLHDKVGDRPTVQLNINLPWVATGVDQVSGRVARYGLQSKAIINWLFADNISFERMLAGRVGRRMRDMGALVKGIEMKAAKVLMGDFDFDGITDVKQESGEVAVAESDIFDQAERLEKNRKQVGDQSNGFFETPFPLSALMTTISGARGTLLEPSAGRGKLLHFARKAKGVKVIVGVEFRKDNFDALVDQFGSEDGSAGGKSHHIINGDFLDLADKSIKDGGLGGGGAFDTIHMNPPFERKAGTGWQDMAHVTKAFGMLAPSGRLVAIVGEGGFFRSDKQSQEFRQFLSDNGATVIKLPEDAFKNSGTGVRTRMIVLDQGAEAGRSDIDVSDMDADSLRSIAEAVPSRQSATLGTPAMPDAEEGGRVLNPAKGVPIPGTDGKKRFRRWADTAYERGYDAMRQVYDVQGMDIPVAKAKAFMDTVGFEGTARATLDNTTAIDADTRVQLFSDVLAELQKRKDAATGDAAAEATAAFNRFVAGASAALTTLGRAINQVKAMQYFTERGAMIEVEKNVTDRQDGMMGSDGKKTEKEIVEILNTENGKVLDDLLKSVKADVKKVRIKKAQVERTVGELPKTKKELDAAIKETFADVGLRIADIIRTHYTEVDAIGQSLVDKLVAEVGLSEAEAKVLDEIVRTRMAQKTEDAKKRVLERLAKEKGGISRRVFTLVDKIVEMSNAGALDQPALRARIAEELKLPRVTDELAKKLKTLTDKRLKMDEGEMRDRVDVDILSELRKARGIGTVDVLTAIYYSHILSGYTTQLVNILSTGINVVAETANLTLRAEIEAAMSRDGMPLGEATYQGIAGLLTGAKMGFSSFYATMDTGYARKAYDQKIPEVNNLMEILSKEPATSAGGKALKGYAFLLRYVTRSMKASDAVFGRSASEAYQRVMAAKIASSQGLMTRPEINKFVRDYLQMSPAQFEQARRRAMNEGYKGSDLGIRTQEIIFQARDQDLVTEAAAFSDEATFNSTPRGAMGAIAEGVGKITNKVPPLKLFVPFTNIVANVTNASVNYSPVGLARAGTGEFVATYAAKVARTLPAGDRLANLIEMAGRLNRGGYSGEAKLRDTKTDKELRDMGIPDFEQERVSLAVKGTAGTLAMIALLAYGMSDDDDGFPFITGFGPTDYAKKQQLIAAGWQPFSIKIGDTRISYLPWASAIPFAFVGNIADGYKYNGYNDETASTVALRGSLAAAGTVVNMSFLQGIKNLFDVWTDQKGAKAERFAANVVTSAAMPNLVRQIDRSLNPQMQDSKGFVESLQAAVPVARTALPDRITPTGNKVESHPLWRFARDEPANIEVLKELNRLGIVVKEPGTGTKINGVTATDEQLRQITVIAAPRFMARIRTALPALRRLRDSEAQNDLVGDIINEERTKAKEQIARTAPRRIPVMPRP